MSLLFFEGFETVGTELGIANQASTRPRIDLRWDSTGSGGVKSTDSFFLIDDSFSEGFAIQMGQNGFSNSNFLRWDIPAGKKGVGVSATEFIVGWRVHIPSTSRTWAMMQVYASFGSGSGNPDFSVGCVNSADVRVSRSVGGAIETATGVFSTDSWHYVECRFLYSGGANNNGIYEVLVDGTQQMIDETARINGNFFSQIEGIRFQCTNQSTGQDFIGYDDIYILEVDGTTPNDFIGSKVRVLSLPPDADGSPNDWTTSTGTTHYTLIDENGADASDYLETTVDTEEEMFDFTDSAANGEFIAVKVEAEAIAQTTTSHTLDVRLSSGTAVAETNHAVTDTANYAVFEHYQATNPNGGGAWTQTTIDAAQIGMQFNT